MESIDVDPAIPTAGSTCHFLELPLELRNPIYSYSIQWPDVSKTFEHFANWRSYKARCKEEKCTTLSAKPDFEEMRTPTILLLNRKTTAEALEILYQQPLMLTLPSPHPMPFPNPVYITEFISEPTLQNVKTVTLDMNLNFNRLNCYGDANGWTRTVKALLEIWRKKNNLRWVEVRGQYIELSKALGWTFAEAAHHKNVVELMSQVCLSRSC